LAAAAPSVGDDRLLDRLDRLTELLELVFAPQLASQRELLRSDPVDAAIFDLTATGWISTGDLQDAAAKKAGTSGRTIRTHLAALAERGLLQKRGAGRSTEFRSSGLV
jgi:hypothetical protein